MLILLAHLFHYSDFVLLPGPVRRVEFSETSERKQIFIILFEFVLGTHNAEQPLFCLEISCTRPFSGASGVP